MAYFTKEMKQRLKDQGWEFSHDYYDYITGETTVYSNKDFPGVYIMESGFGNFVIYSDNVYKTEEEKIQEAYDKGYKEAKTKFTPNALEAGKRALELYNLGYSRGYRNGFKHGKENTNKTERLSNKSV